jgi:hypothetical protein
MRRTRLAAAVLLIKIMLAVALVPLIAYAADLSTSYEGIYEGAAEGVGTDGGGGSTGVVVWVEDEGDVARFTIEVAEFGIVIAAEGPVTEQAGALTVPLSVDSMGVRGEAVMSLVNSDGAWLLTGTGQGEALGYEGTGSLAAERVSAGFPLPPIGEQIGEMISNITGGPARAKTPAPRVTTGGGQAKPVPTAPEGTPEAPAPGEAPETAEEPAPETPGAQETTAVPSQAAASEPAALAPAEPEPPLADFSKLIAAGLAVVVLLLQVILA